MKGIEAKYIAKTLGMQLASMKEEHNEIRAYLQAMDAWSFQNQDKVDFDVISDVLYCQAVGEYMNGRIMETTTLVRAYLIRNAFKKSRNFNSSEVMYYNMADSEIEMLREDLVAYSRYSEKWLKQNKAIETAKNLIDESEKEQFNAWLENANIVSTYSDFTSKKSEELEMVD